MRFSNEAARLSDLTDKQLRVLSARLYDSDSWGRIAHREKISRPSALGLFRRGLRRMRADGSGRSVAQ